MMKSLRKALLLGKLYIIVCLLFSGCMPENIEFSNEVHVEPVDLGLSVKWAPCNVGATSPEEYGGYYAWGEVEEKSNNYSWSTYKWSEDDWDDLIKYCTRDMVYGIEDNKTTLDSDDDVAHVKWGNNWRMPTATEMDELLNKCAWSWTAVNGIQGYLVTGPNGNSIFLPAAGTRDEDGVRARGSYGHYWTVTLNNNENNNAHGLYFSDEKYVRNLKGNRCVGISVRPVYGESNEEEATSPVAVDLGLTVNWASCNVGASSPEEYGDYFAWGETDTKSDYYESNSATYWLSISQLKSNGVIDSDGNLTAVYDAATMNLGSDWRTPTSDEIAELVNGCYWEWITMNGVNGYKVKSRTNDNSIFLPAAGYRYGTSLNSAGFHGSYWSATHPSNVTGRAFYLYFNSGYYGLGGDGIYKGCMVRPVSDK